jgi:hypothetical protein
MYLRLMQSHDLEDQQHVSSYPSTDIYADHHTHRYAMHHIHPIFCKVCVDNTSLFALVRCLYSDTLQMTMS